MTLRYLLLISRQGTTESLQKTLGLDVLELTLLRTNRQMSLGKMVYAHDDQGKGQDDPRSHTNDHRKAFPRMQFS